MNKIQQLLSGEPDSLPIHLFCRAWHGPPGGSSEGDYLSHVNDVRRCRKRCPDGFISVLDSEHISALLTFFYVALQQESRGFTVSPFSWNVLYGNSRSSGNYLRPDVKVVNSTIELSVKAEVWRKPLVMEKPLGKGIKNFDIFKKM